MMSRESWDVAIVGSGPAGLAAAIHCAAAGLSVVVLERAELGGYALGLSRVLLVPGSPVGLTGEDFVRLSLARLSTFGGEIQAAEAVAVRAEGMSRAVQLAAGAAIVATAVIIATGVDLPESGTPGMTELTGAGVYFGQPSGVPEALKSRDVLLTGTIGDLGGVVATLSAACRSVTWIGGESPLAIRTAEELRLLSRRSMNTAVRQPAEIIELSGVDQLETVSLRDLKSGRITFWSASALFLLGMDCPRSGWLGGEVALDERGLIVTGGLRTEASATASTFPLSRRQFSRETSIPGVFAAGGVRKDVGCWTHNVIEDGIAAARDAGEYVAAVVASSRRSAHGRLPRSLQSRRLS